METKQPKINTATVKLKKGLTMFEMNSATGNITKASVRQLTLDRVSVILQPGHIYLPALRVKSAKRKFENQVKQFLQDNGQ